MRPANATGSARNSRLPYRRRSSRSLASPTIFYVQVLPLDRPSRRRYALREGQRRQRAEFKPLQGSFPGIVGPVIAMSPLVNDQFTNGRMTILRLRVDRYVERSDQQTGDPVADDGSARPVANASSVLDLYSLASFPTLTTGERFVVYGTDSAAAKALAGSSLRALVAAGHRVDDRWPGNAARLHVAAVRRHRVQPHDRAWRINWWHTCRP